MRTQVIAVCLLLLFSAAAHNIAVQQTAEQIEEEARRAFLEGRYALAADLARRVYDMRRATIPADELQIATAAFTVGKVSLSAERTGDAVRYLNLACDAFAAQLGDSHARFGACLLDLAEARAAAKQIADAKLAASRALRVIEASFPPDRYAAAVFHTGEIFKDTQENATALEYFQQAATLYGPSNLNEPGFLAAALLESAQLLHAEGRYGEAAAALEQITPEAGDDGGRLSASVASKIYLLADCYRELGEYDKALSLLGKVARSLVSVDAAGHTTTEDVLLQIADLQYGSGGHADALTTLQRVLKPPPAERNVTEVNRAVRALHLAGRAHAALHEYRESERSFEAALQNARTLGDNGALLSNSLIEMGFFLLRRGRYAEARARFEEALPLVEQATGRDSAEVAQVLERASVGLINQNDCAAARPMIARARAIYSRRAPVSPEMAQVLQIAARCAATKTHRAVLVAEALQLQRRLEGESLEWLVASASHHLDQGDLAKAEVAVEKALKFAPANARVGELVATIWDHRGRHADAARLLREQIAAVAANYGEDSINVAARRFNLGRTLLRASDTNAARQSFLLAATSFGRHTEQLFAMLSLAEQQQLLVQQTAVQISGVLSVCQNDPCLSDAYSTVVPWKGLLIDGLRSQNDLVRAAQAHAGDPAFARLRKVRAQLVLWASTREARAYDEWKKKHDALAAEKEALERTVLASGATVNFGSISLQVLQSALGESEVLIDIYKFDQFDRTSTWQSTYAAVITGRTAAPRFVRIGAARQVEALVAQWLEGVEADRSEPAWAALATAVWAPLLRALPEGTRVVRVSGEADLVRIPWHAFTQPDAAKASLDVVEVSSARSLVNARSRSRPIDQQDRVLIVGGVDYDAGRTPRTPGYPNTPFPRLRWTTDESQQIETLARGNGMEPEWLKEAAATRNAVLQKMNSGTYLHFASHGFVPDESGDGSARTPLVDSGIALSGANVRHPVTLQNAGILTAEEILEIDLSRARLVVLSACKTALGVKASGQGILGLRSSLHAAGAHRIVMSLWSVDDEATQLLMSAFYRNLWVNRMPLLAAFHAAQESVRKNERFRAPRFWAGWSIVDPD